MMDRHSLTVKEAIRDLFMDRDSEEEPDEMMIQTVVLCQKKIVIQMVAMPTDIHVCIYRQTSKCTWR